MLATIKSTMTKPPPTPIRCPTSPPRTPTTYAVPSTITASPTSEILAGESSRALHASQKRNDNRLRNLQLQNRTILGTYPPSEYLSLNQCIPGSFHLQETQRKPNPTLLRLIKHAINYYTPAFSKPPFIFNASPEATRHNTKLLRQHDYDLHSILTATHTICTPGAEFRDTRALSPLLHQHPLWPFTKKTLIDGAQLLFHHRPNDQHRQEENLQMLSFNNHKRAKLMPELV
jgi:hypothetical protein